MSTIKTKDTSFMIKMPLWQQKTFNTNNFCQYGRGGDNFISAKKHGTCFPFFMLDFSWIYGIFWSPEIIL